MTDNPTEDLTDAQLVRNIAVALYGDRWIADLARELDVNRRTVERVAQAAAEGRNYPAARAWLDDLSKLAFRRKDALDVHLDRLAAVVNMPFRLVYYGNKGAIIEQLYPSYAEAALYAAKLFQDGAAITDSTSQRTTAVRIMQVQPGEGPFVP